jgi:protein gp37
MNKTKIDWATMSWNPVTGCRHGCPYCYARRTARRFDAGCVDPTPLPGGLHVLTEKIKATPYPYGFEPTMHRYRLNQPERQEEPQTVFVCSMADLFGRWVPTSWIVEVLDACRRAPQHRYLFLTKNPARYLELDHMALLPHESNFWYGSTVANEDAEAMYTMQGVAYSMEQALRLPSVQRRFTSMVHPSSRWRDTGRPIMATPTICSPSESPMENLCPATGP